MRPWLVVAAQVVGNAEEPPKIVVGVLQVLPALVVEMNPTCNEELPEA